jgi:16S rRNA (adenine1518-N6/adenine1519-N6)-dimethyltransferase
MTGNRAPARKRFGQHFLESTWAEKVVRAVAPQDDDTFLEIGPGRGALTRPLAAGAARVIGFEIDRDLAADLRTSGPPNLTVVEGDFLEVSADSVRGLLAAHGAPSSVRVAGNLPYNIASPILFKLADLFGAGIPLVDATVMLQREVADRLLADPGTGEYGVLTALIRHSADVDRLLRLPPGAFRPPPEVHSTVVRLRFHPPVPPVSSLRVFREMTQAIFTRRRKTLANALLAFAGSQALAPKVALDRAGIDPQRRPETLTVDELARLSDLFVRGT